MKMHESCCEASRPYAALTYPCSEPPGAGEAREIALGVQWLRMPMPGELSHINLWAIRDGGAMAVIDTGLHTPETMAAWRALACAEGPFEGRVPRRALVTHMHPDHVGMAGWLGDEYGCELSMTRGEYLSCRVLAADTGLPAPEVGVNFYRRAGWSDASIELYRSRFGSFGKFISPLPQRYHRLLDGDEVRIGDHKWQVVIGAGHSPEHACFYCPELRLFASGDQVLPRISSNISVFPTEPDADPLGEWLATLEALRTRVPDNVLVLPSHGDPFVGLHGRIDRLIDGQQRALDRLRGLLETKHCRAVDVFGALFSRKIEGDHQQLGLATGESLACLNYLLKRGEIDVSEGADGVAWWRLA